ncbi:hypothetical protein L596_029391 [Steinernema carpocapsae]|uniref:Uncharacterized protein n=1 Tax=Steinernema carpocapsae TaxID=34508 RepID=A0A4U5LUH5_STECR|nr:hypothetical protein L596_029391 [Steinernema carpocapsae]
MSNILYKVLAFQEESSYLDYPSSGVYEGPIDETGRAHDVDGEPLDHHVSVYHSGRSDEPTDKISEQPLRRREKLDLSEAGSRLRSLRRTIDETGRAHDVDGEPLDHHVSVYHSGRSDEPTGKAPEHTKSRLMSSILLLISGNHHRESPRSEDKTRSLRRNIDKTGRAHDVDGEPLDHHVSVYHSGRSDEPTGKAPEQTKSRLMSNILLSGVYEGHIDKTGRAHDVDGEPLDHHVSVYHSGRSMSQLEKPLNKPKSRLMSNILLLISGKPSPRKPKIEDKSNWPLQEDPAHSTIPAPESTKDISIRLEELMTWMRAS